MRSGRPYVTTAVTALAVTAMASMLAIVALTSGTLLVTASPAWAHSQLVGTRPAADSTVTSAVTTVVLTFNERIQGRFSTIVVRGPGDASYGDGPLRTVDTDVVQDVFPLRSGAYRVAWRVVSADGHPLSGEFRFTVNLPAQLEPSAGPPTASPTGALGQPDAAGPGSWWRWIIPAVIGLVLLGLIIGVVIRRRRTRTGGAP